MVTIGLAVLLAFFVAPAPWGIVLVVSAVAWEVLEKGLWFVRSKRIPIAVGSEAMIGQSAHVIATCKPYGKVRFSSERWNARCTLGADVGDTVVVEAVERLTLIVRASQYTRP